MDSSTVQLAGEDLLDIPEGGDSRSQGVERALASGQPRANLIEAPGPAEREQGQSLFPGTPEDLFSDSGGSLCLAHLREAGPKGKIAREELALKGDDPVLRRAVADQERVVRVVRL